MVGFAGKWLAVGLIFINIVACSNGDSGKSAPLEDKKVINYNTKSCDYTVTQGDIPSQQIIGTSIISKAYFGKEFNQNYLDAVASTSVDATINFVNQTGTTVYKSSLIDTQYCSASLFVGADIMPKDVQSKWDDAMEQIDGKEGFILGLYLPRTSSKLLPSLNVNAAIIVRENTNRWTLIHEFMHHLFLLRAAEQGYDQDMSKVKLSKALKELMDALNRKGISDSELVLGAVEPYITFAESVDDQLIHFTLEEMTIEATLKEAYNNNKIKYAPSTSNWYINSSAEMAVKMYDNIKELGEQIYLELPQSKDELRTKVSAILDKVRDRKLEIAQIKQKYPYYEQSLDQNALLAGYHPHNEGCSHQVESERILNMTNKIKFPSKKVKTFH